MKDQIARHDIVKQTESEQVINLSQNKNENQFKNESKKPTFLVKPVTSFETKLQKVKSLTSFENEEYTFFQDEDDLSAERVSEVNKMFDKKEKINKEKSKLKSRCQFHQHFTYEFFVRTSFRKLFLLHVHYVFDVRTKNASV